MWFEDHADQSGAAASGGREAGPLLNTDVVFALKHAHGQAPAFRDLSSAHLRHGMPKARVRCVTLHLTLTDLAR